MTQRKIHQLTIAETKAVIGGAMLPQSLGYQVRRPVADRNAA